MKKLLLILCASSLLTVAAGIEKVPIWDRFELRLIGEAAYENPIYDVGGF